MESVYYTNSFLSSERSCPKQLTLKCHDSVKINFPFIGTPRAHHYYVDKMYARFEYDPLKTGGGDDYTNPLPCSVKAAQNGRDSVKNNFISIKTPRAHLH